MTDATPYAGGNRGSGPGAIAPDGSAVELYASLPAGGEPELIHSVLPPGAAILELGAGAGRMTRPLVRLGHPVVAVDASAEMLAHIGDLAPTVHAPIEGLDLGRRFDAVLLASYLIEVADDAVRAEFLATARRHLAPTGVVLIQRTPPGWWDRARPYTRRTEAVTSRLVEVTRHGGGRLSATMEYGIGGRAWTHSFTIRVLGEDELRAALTAAGLELAGYAGGDPAWVIGRCDS